MEIRRYGSIYKLPPHIWVDFFEDKETCDRVTTERERNHALCSRLREIKEEKSIEVMVQEFIERLNAWSENYRRENLKVEFREDGKCITLVYSSSYFYEIDAVFNDYFSREEDGDGY